MLTRQVDELRCSAYLRQTACHSSTDIWLQSEIITRKANSRWQNVNKL